MWLHVQLGRDQPLQSGEWGAGWGRPRAPSTWGPALAVQPCAWPVPPKAPEGMSPAPLHSVAPWWVASELQLAQGFSCVCLSCNGPVKSYR